MTILNRKLKRVSAGGARAVAVAAGVALAVALGAGSAFAVAKESNRRTPAVTAIEKSSPAVVNISTEQIVRERFDPFHGFGGFGDEYFKQFDDFFSDFGNPFPSRDYKRQTLGSGVIIDKKGYVLTNQHVIMQGSKITVTLPDHREFEGIVVGADTNIDLAIVKIDVKGELPVAAIGDSDSLLIGETVIAIGNPFGLEHTVTTGVLSAKNRSIKGSDNKVYNNFLQTDASINPGNSGGPLVNLDGEVIGINTAIYAEGQGIGFAIPINRAQRAISDLIKFGAVKRAWFGARAQELTPDLAETFGYKGSYGALVADILGGGPAEKAGLLRGDIIMEIENSVIHSVEDFYNRVSGSMIGEKLVLKIFRNGAEDKLTVAAGAPPVDTALDVASQWLGVKVAAVDAKSASLYKLRATEGVVVTEAVEKGPAFATGIRKGDVIRQFGEMTVANIEDFKMAVVLGSERPSVVVMIQRGMNLYRTAIGSE